MIESREMDISGLSVCMGIPSSRDISPLVVKSMFATKELCSKVGIQCDLAMVAGNAVIQWARDEVVDLMLQSNANRFFFIDSDIVWDAEDFVRMLALSSVYDVVCASYVAKHEPATFYIRYDNSKPLAADEYGLIEIDGAGLGFTIISRTAVEKIAAYSERVNDEISGKSYASIFKVGVSCGNRRGEDMSFFEEIKRAGYKIHLDPSISLGHIGTKVYRGRVLDAMSIVKE